jgi:hypothetical protein
MISTCTSLDRNSILITDNIALPVGLSNPVLGLIVDLFTVQNSNVGINIIDPQFGLHISGSLFAPVISGSTMQIQGAPGDTDLFIVKSYASEDTKFVINLQGVTILGQFETPPDFALGGMFFSSSGDFYLGS